MFGKKDLQVVKQTIDEFKEIDWFGNSQNIVDTAVKKRKI